MEVLKTTGNRALDEEINRILARITTVEGGGNITKVVPTSTTQVVPSSSQSIPLHPFNNGSSGAGPVALNFAASTNQAVTLTGSPAIAFSGLTAGYSYTLELVQDGTGSRTVTWPGSGLAWQGGVAPTLTATAGKTDLLGFYFDGATMVGHVIAQGF